MFIGVIGASKCDSKTAALAERVGEQIAKAGAHLVCGGLGGVMEHAAKGAREAGGTTIGILPGKDKKEANPYIDIPIVTGLSYARNILVVSTCDVVIALPGKYGTLSEIAFALNIGKSVIGIETWDIPGIIKADDAEDALLKAKEVLKT
ncbi:MAG: TIGR00725 family protein [bacterium]